MARQKKPRETRFAFPQAGEVYDLVSGRAFGRVKEIVLPFENGTPYAFAQFPAPVKLTASVNGATVTFAYSTPVDGAVRLRVFRPDGTEAKGYAKNVQMNAGRGDATIPFCLSDPLGTWRLEATSIFGDGREMTMGRF